MLEASPNWHLPNEEALLYHQPHVRCAASRSASYCGCNCASNNADVRVATAITVHRLLQSLCQVRAAQHVSASTIQQSICRLERLLAAQEALATEQTCQLRVHTSHMGMSAPAGHAQTCRRTARVQMQKARDGIRYRIAWWRLATSHLQLALALVVLPSAADALGGGTGGACRIGPLVRFIRRTMAELLPYPLAGEQLAKADMGLALSAQPSCGQIAALGSVLTEPPQATPAAPGTDQQQLGGAVPAEHLAAAVAGRQACLSAGWLVFQHWCSAQADWSQDAAVCSGIKELHEVLAALSGRLKQLHGMSCSCHHHRCKGGICLQCSTL